MVRNSVVFWNCNGWHGDGTIDKASLLGGVASDEEAELICVTDVRLDEFGGLKGKSSVCRTLERITGKTWRGEYITRKEDKRIGGTYIFHTIDWTNVSIKAALKYGVIT